MDKIIIGIVVLSTAAMIALVYFLQAQSPANREPKGEPVEIQGAEHISQGSTDHPPYNSNPPTAGWHWPEEAPWGIYEQTIPDEQMVHNLEHGGVVVAYKPELDESTKAKLKEIVRGYRSKVILEPRPQNDSLIALVSWGRILKLESFDEAKISQFIKLNRNRGPERVAD